MTIDEKNNVFIYCIDVKKQVVVHYLSKVL
jgi:hypothetical protein